MYPYEDPIALIGIFKKARIGDTFTDLIHQMTALSRDGHADATYALALGYADSSLEDYLTWLRKAVQQNHIEATQKLLDYYINGYAEVVPPDLKKVAWLLETLERSSFRSIRELASKYPHLRAFPKTNAFIFDQQDWGNAALLKWWQKRHSEGLKIKVVGLVVRGNARAAYLLSKDCDARANPLLQQRIFWLKWAASLSIQDPMTGEPKAFFELGKYYLEVDLDLERAAECFSKIFAGFDDALITVAQKYLDGNPPLKQEMQQAQVQAGAFIRTLEEALSFNINDHEKWLTIKSLIREDNTLLEGVSQENLDAFLALAAVYDANREEEKKDDVALHHMSKEVGLIQARKQYLLNAETHADPMALYTNHILGFRREISSEHKLRRCLQALYWLRRAYRIQDRFGYGAYRYYIVSSDPTNSEFASFLIPGMPQSSFEKSRFGFDTGRHVSLDAETSQELHKRVGVVNNEHAISSFAEIFSLPWSPSQKYEAFQYAFHLYPHYLDTLSLEDCDALQTILPKALPPGLGELKEEDPIPQALRERRKQLGLPLWNWIEYFVQSGDEERHELIKKVFTHLARKESAQALALIKEDLRKIWPSRIVNLWRKLTADDPFPEMARQHCRLLGIDYPNLEEDIDDFLVKIDNKVAENLQTYFKAVGYMLIALHSWDIRFSAFTQLSLPDKAAMDEAYASALKLQPARAVAPAVTSSSSSTIATYTTMLLMASSSSSNSAQASASATSSSSMYPTLFAAASASSSTSALVAPVASPPIPTAPMLPLEDILNPEELLTPSVIRKLQHRQMPNFDALLVGVLRGEPRLTAQFMNFLTNMQISAAQIKLVFENLKSRPVREAQAADQNFYASIAWVLQGEMATFCAQLSKKPNYQKANDCFEKARQLGNSYGIAGCAWMLYRGHIGPADRAAGLEVYEQAIRMQNPMAMSNRAYSYLKDDSSNPADLTRAIELLKQSFDLGYLFSGVLLSQVYEMGKGTPKDPAAAFRAMKAASDAGLVQAMIGLGEMHRDGKGTLQDVEEAIRLFQAASNEGSGFGSYLLARIYEEDKEKKDEGKFNKYIDKAIERGNAFGMLRGAGRLVKGDDPAAFVIAAKLVYRATWDSSKEKDFRSDLSKVIKLLREKSQDPEVLYYVVMASQDEAQIKAFIAANPELWFDLFSHDEFLPIAENDKCLTYYKSASHKFELDWQPAAAVLRVPLLQILTEMKEVIAQREALIELIRFDDQSLETPAMVTSAAAEPALEQKDAPSAKLDSLLSQIDDETLATLLGIFIRADFQRMEPSFHVSWLSTQMSHLQKAPPKELLSPTTLATRWLLQRIDSENGDQGKRLARLLITRDRHDKSPYAYLEAIHSPERSHLMDIFMAIAPQKPSAVEGFARIFSDAPLSQISRMWDRLRGPKQEGREMASVFSTSMDQAP